MQTNTNLILPGIYSIDDPRPEHYNPIIGTILSSITRPDGRIELYGVFGAKDVVLSRNQHSDSGQWVASLWRQNTKDWTTELTNVYEPVHLTEQITSRDVFPRPLKKDPLFTKLKYNDVLLVHCNDGTVVASTQLRHDHEYRTYRLPHPGLDIRLDYELLNQVTSLVENSRVHVVARMERIPHNLT